MTPLWILLSFALSDQPAPPAKFGQEIVVTAAREAEPRDQAAAAVTVLDRKAIDRLPAQSLSEVLGFVPGMTMMFDSGASGIPMITSRGFFGGGEVEYVKMLVDGVPTGDVESGNVDWQRFRAANIDRIEVLHGPGSSLYGDAALGGVVQVFTRAVGPTVYVGVGSFGGLDLQASDSADLGGGLRLAATAGSWETDGFRERANTSDRTLALSMERLTSRSRWSLGIDGDREHRHQPGPLTQNEIDADRTQSNAFFRFDGQSTTRRRVDGTYESFGTLPVRATLFATGRDDDNLRTLLLAPGFASSAFRALRTRTLGGTFEVSREWSRLTLRAGTDLDRATLSGRYASVSASGSTGSETGNENGSRIRSALFVTAGWAVTDHVRLSAGLRHDDIGDRMTATTTAGASSHRSATAWSPRAGINVRLGDGPAPLSLFAQASEAFKAPTLDQLFDPRPYPNGFGGTLTISNPGLLPQRARNLEAGLSRSTSSSDWSVVAYRLSVRDEIDFDVQTFGYRNIGSSLHRGVEASAAVAKEARLSPQVTYAWTSVNDRAVPGVQLKNIPEHTAQLLLHARLSPATSADAIYRWRGDLGLDDAGVFRTPAVSRVDFRVAHDIGSVRLQADLLNALDAHYNELGYVLVDFRGRPSAFQFPAPGRAVRLGATWTLTRRRNE